MPEGKPKISNFKFEFPQDELNKRLADAEQRLQLSGTPELQFLLAYVYYQTGRVRQSKEAIDVAFKQMPKSPAVAALKRAIDSTVAESQSAIK